MSEHLIWQVGNRNPSITEDIVDSAGAPVNLTGATVQFRMRPVGSSTLKVDQPATIVTPTAGTVRYDWAAADVDTAGDYLVWWVVTSGGKTQDVAEAMIEFRAHAPEPHTYVELEEFKSTAQLTGKGFADDDIRSALVAASRAVDFDTGRRFYLDAADEDRYYTWVPPAGTYWDRDAEFWQGSGAFTRRPLQIDDLTSLTTLTTAPNSDASFTDTWVVNTDFVLEPRSAPADGLPYTEIRPLPNTSRSWPAWPDSIKVTGKFGWVAVPENVKIATGILAARLVKWRREAPSGVMGFGGDGTVVRISRSIPDWDILLANYRRRRLFA